MIGLHNISQSVHARLLIDFFTSLGPSVHFIIQEWFIILLVAVQCLFLLSYVTLSNVLNLLFILSKEVNPPALIYMGKDSKESK